mgnify:CR=1 FL=1
MNMMVTQISLMNGEKEMAINTLKELIVYLKREEISVFHSKKTGVLCIEGQHKNLIESIQEINDKEIEVWESFYNNKWSTFLKKPGKYNSTNKSNESIEHLSNKAVNDYYACSGFCTKGKPWESEVGWHKGEW